MANIEQQQFVYEVITGGCIGYMEIQVKNDIPFEELEETCKNYNSTQKELKTGCQMHILRETVNKEVEEFFF